MKHLRRHPMWCAPIAAFAATGFCAAFAHGAGGSVARNPQVQNGNDPAWAWGPDMPGGYASDHIMIKLAPGAQIALGADGQIHARTSKGGYDWRMSQTLSAAAPTSAARAWSMPPASTARVKQLGIDRWVMLRVPHGTDIPALVARVMLAAHGGATVQWAEVDAIGTVADTAAPTPNDPDFNQQWGLENTGQTVNTVPGTPGADIRARAAWHYSIGSPNNVIAVLDSGVNHHDDLLGRVLPGWNVPQQNTLTDDGCNSHGTHVSGILGATGDNAAYVAGLAWNASILPVVVVNPCSGQSSWLADGLYYATDHGATVVNMSLQYSVGTQYLYDAVVYTLSAGIPMVAAAGNGGPGPVAWPAKWAEVIAVGSIASNNAAAPTTAVGPEVDVAAPGVNIQSLKGYTDAGLLSGTSMACPHVTGTIALMQAAAPTLSVAQLRSALEGTVVDIQAPGFDNTSGHGRINAGAAVRAARAMAGLGDMNGDGFVDGADLGALLGAWGGCGTPCPADLNDDDTVDGADLGILLGNWGSPS